MSTVMQLNAEVRAAVELRRWLENEGASDPQFDDLVLDAIEGETRLNEMIAALAREAILAEAMAEGVKTVIAANKARAERLLRKAESFRAAIGRAMDEAGLPKTVSPDLTITYRQGQARPFVEDETDIPKEFLRTKVDTSPDMKRIGDYIADTGKTIPGVVLRNGAPILTIREK